MAAPPVKTPSDPSDVYKEYLRTIKEHPQGEAWLKQLREDKALTTSRNAEEDAMAAHYLALRVSERVDDRFVKNPSTKEKQLLDLLNKRAARLGAESNKAGTAHESLLGKKLSALNIADPKLKEAIQYVYSFAPDTETQSTSKKPTEEGVKREAAIRDKYVKVEESIRQLALLTLPREDTAELYARAVMTGYRIKHPDEANTITLDDGRVAQFYISHFDKAYRDLKKTIAQAKQLLPIPDLKPAMTTILLQLSDIQRDMENHLNTPPPPSRDTPPVVPMGKMKEKGATKEIDR